MKSEIEKRGQMLPLIFLSRNMVLMFSLKKTLTD